MCRSGVGPAPSISGYFYIIFGAFVIVAFGNAVNLTDGLDGLATHAGDHCQPGVHD